MEKIKDVLKVALCVVALSVLIPDLFYSFFAIFLPDGALRFLATFFRYFSLG